MLQGRAGVTSIHPHEVPCANPAAEPDLLGTKDIAGPAAAADRAGRTAFRVVKSNRPARQLSMVVRVRHEGVAETVLLFERR